MRSWASKFRCALQGICDAFRDQISFWVHLPCAVIVVAAAIYLEARPWQWALLTTAIGMVLVAEMFNSALELLVQVLHPETHPTIGRAIDIAAGAVLLATLSAIAIGVATLGPDLYRAVF